MSFGLSDRSLQDAKYDVTYHTNASYGKTEGVNNTFSRPTIKGYNELQLSKPGHQDLYHNFPRMIDDVVVQHGYPLSPTNGGTMYVLPGHINGAPGYFGIKINNAGIIYHRHFVPLSRAGSMY